MRDTHSPSRREITDQHEKLSGEIEEREGDLEQISRDLEKIQNLWKELDLSGSTADGSLEIRESVLSSESTAEGILDQRDGALDESQEATEEFATEIGDREETSERSLGRISDVSAPIETREVVDAVREVKEASLRDIEFLRGVLERAKETLDDSRRRQDEFGRDRKG